MKTRLVRQGDPRRPGERRRVATAWFTALLLGGVLASASAPSRETRKLETAPALTAASLAKAQLFTLEPAAWKDPPEAPLPGPQPIPLVVDFARNKVEVGTEGKLQDVRLRSYNGGLVGPTFRVKPGDTLRIDFYNRLPKPPAAGAHANMEQCGIHERNDVTNLHTHGLHISPEGESDNVLREIEPGGPGAPASHYVFKILPNGNPSGWPSVDHFPGTHWYHAHLHGGTAVQLASGMAGALLIAGKIDQIPAIERAKERIFLFQQLAFDKDGEIKSFKDLNANWTGANPQNGPKKHTSINGVVKPLIEMRPGRVERWRMIDAGVFELLDLSLRKKDEPSKTLTFHQLALDGITLPRVRPATQVELAPGYRVDALVQAPLEKGTYLLYKSRPRLNLLAFATDTPAARQAPEPEILAQIEVRGDPCTSPTNPCSTALVDPRTDLGAPFKDITKDEIKDPVKTVTFSVDAGPKFQVNGKCFDPDHVMPEFDLRLGSTEEWVLKNTSQGPHPFHIHVNPFQLVNSDGSPGDWRDTIIVPPGAGEVRMRTHIERFSGKYVLHCHILTHEDQGMMQLVEVKKK